MLKPMKTVRLRTVGSGLGFARKITERSAVPGTYDMSGSELVFLMGAAREREDLMSVLEMLDEALELVRRGFDRHARALSVRIINNIGIILSRGGFSKEYFDTLDIFNKISPVIGGSTENFSFSECRREIQSTLSALRSKTVNRPSGVRERALKTVSEHSRTMTLNTMNSGIFRLMSRDRELQKMIKNDKLFTELSLKNIEKLRRRTDRVLAAERFFDNLTDRQIELLESLINKNGLFSELRESNLQGFEKLSETDRRITRSDLKYLVENSSEKSLTQFFETLKKAVGESKKTSSSSEKSYFESVRKMRDFFVTAKTSEIKDLIKTLSRDSSYRTEAVTLAKALEIYRKNSENRVSPGENLTGTAPEHRFDLEALSYAEFLKLLETSRGLKTSFSHYARENYRSEETMKRFSEYLSLNSRNITAAGQSSSDAEAPERIPGADNGVEKEYEKERFVDFLINSNGLNTEFSESLKNSFINASSDVAAAFAEYLVNTVREGSFNYFSGTLRALAEKTERLLYYEDTEAENTVSLIREAWNECGSELAGLYSGFTQNGGFENYFHSELKKFDSYIAKNNYTAVYDLPNAAADGDLNGFPDSGMTFPDAREYTFYDALTEISDSELTLLLPLAGAVKGENPGSFSGTVSREAAASPKEFSGSGNAPTDRGSLGKISGTDTFESRGISERSFRSDTVESRGISERSFRSDTVESRGISERHFNSDTVESRGISERHFNSDTVESRGISERHFNSDTVESRGISESFFNSDTAESRENFESFFNSGTAESRGISESFFNSGTAESRGISESFFNSDTVDSRGISESLNSEIVFANINTAASEFESFSEYLSGVLKSRELQNTETKENLERIKTLSEKLENALKREKTVNLSEALDLIFREWKENPGLVSRLYTGLERSQAVSEGFSSRLERLFVQLDSGKSTSENGISTFYSKEISEELLVLSNMIPSFSNTRGNSAEIFYNIRNAGNETVSQRSIVINRKLHNAIKTFFRAFGQNSVQENYAFTNSLYPLYTVYALGEKDYFFTRESENALVFDREKLNDLFTSTNGFRERRSSHVLTFSGRISEKSSAGTRLTDYNKPIELFYTDEYFESSPNGMSGVSVNFAVPSASDAGSSDNVSEKLESIHEKIESINSELAQIKQRGEEESREFVTRSEQKLFERDLKNSIERDIYLAGKRHGIK